jgi:hypothetical protein
VHAKRIFLLALILLALPAYFFLSDLINNPNDNNPLQRIVGQDAVDLISGDANVTRTDPTDNISRNTVGIDTNNPGGSDFADISEAEPPAIAKLYEVFGIVIDENNQPIENALISDEMSGTGTRSDASGNYQIFIELPKFKNPLLNFLRSGYKGNRINISAKEFETNTSLKLDVKLLEAPDSTSLDGWIGNDVGSGLVRQKIRITSRSALGFGTIFYVVYSDEKGDFSFEGIKSGIPYKLEVYPTAGYPGFVIDVLNVTQFTPRLNIVLDRLKLVDLKGMVVNREAAPVPDFKMNVENISTRFPVRKLSTDSSGFFNLDSFPTGQIKFSTLAPEYFIISGITLSENESQNLILMIDKGSNYLSGWVSDQNGIPLKNARVTLDANFLDGDIESYSYRSRYTDTAGTFSFTDVGNSTHLITVYADGFKSRQMTHQFTSPTDDIHITVIPN